MHKMNFVKFNNNNEPNNMAIESHYQDKLKVDTSVPMTVYGNCQMTKVQYNCDLKDEYCFVEKFDSDHNVKNDREAKMSGKARVLVEKLPDSVVQQYLAKKEKNHEKMNFGRKLSDSSEENFVSKNKIGNCTESSLVNRCLVKKEKFETDKFVRELCKPMMKQYLANTEMGCLTDDFEEISDSPQYPARADNYTTDSLIQNLSGNPDAQYPVQMETSYQDQFIKSLSSPTVQQCNVDLSYPMMQEFNMDVEKLDEVIKSSTNVIAQENSFKRKNISKQNSRTDRRRCRTNITTKLCKRICLICCKYVRKTHKTSDKVECDTCKELTFFECNACRKIANTYSGITHHLLYCCEVRDSYKCAHCKYFVKKKQTLSCHIRRNHKHLIGRKSGKSTENISNKSNRGTEYDKRFENLIVLKKQKEMKCKSEWIIENVKRSDLRANKSVDSSVLSKTISNQPMQNSTSSSSVEKLAQLYQLYCEHCNKEMTIDDIHTQNGTYCRTCGTDVRFKCLKCQSTCESYHSMKDHFKKFCAFKKNSREYFHCSECNYRSVFQGLVINHHHKVHGFDQSHQSSSDDFIQNN